MSNNLTKWISIKRHVFSLTSRLSVRFQTRIRQSSRRTPSWWRIHSTGTWAVISCVTTSTIMSCICQNKPRPWHWASSPSAGSGSVTRRRRTPTSWRVTRTTSFSHSRWGVGNVPGCYTNSWSTGDDYLISTTLSTTSTIELICCESFVLLLSSARILYVAIVISFAHLCWMLFVACQRS